MAYTITKADVGKWLAKHTTCTAITWDVVFLDPPFRFDMAQYNEVLALLHNCTSISAATLIYLECQHIPHMPPAHWTIKKHKTIGGVQSLLFSKASQ